MNEDKAYKLIGSNEILCGCIIGNGNETNEQMDAINYLCEEYDYGYFSSRSKFEYFIKAQRYLNKKSNGNKSKVDDLFKHNCRF